MNRRNFAQASAAAVATLLLQACEARTGAGPGPAIAAAAGSTAGAAKPDGKQAYEMAAGGTGFVLGPIMAAHTVYVFFDAACPHCAHLWSAAQPLAKKLKMIWMPVGLLRSSSAPQGATILSAPNPLAAMAENEASVLDRKAGIAVNPALPPEVLAKVQANTDLFNKIGGDGVPLIVYKNARTGNYGVQSGATDTSGLSALVGVE